MVRNKATSVQLSADTASIRAESREDRSYSFSVVRGVSSDTS